MRRGTISGRSSYLARVDGQHDKFFVTRALYTSAMKRLVLFGKMVNCRLFRTVATPRVAAGELMASDNLAGNANLLFMKNGRHEANLNKVVLHTAMCFGQIFHSVC